MSKMITLAKLYGIPTQATPEDLESRRGKIITFNDRVIFVGQFYHQDGHCYFAAIYTFLDADHSCEGFIGLEAVSEERFIDDGHAVFWALHQK